MLPNYVKRTAKYVLARAGYELRTIIRDVDSSSTEVSLPGEQAWVKEIITRVHPYTLTSAQKIASMCHAVEYIVRCRIPGDIVECGVWKGGSMMAAALALLKLGDDQRTLHLFDTFEGMTPPTDIDRTVRSGILAEAILANDPLRSPAGPWAYAALDEVRTNLTAIRYPAHRIAFVKGRVEDTLPANAPEEIALLRLDTDWYDSTRHELLHLFPRLAPRGVLIVDDYGFWTGSRQATDEYIEQHGLQLLLNRVEPTGRIAVKPDIAS